MKIHKKIGFGLGFGLAVILTGLALNFFWGGKSLAYTAGQINADQATTKYNFTGKGAKTITMNIAGDTLHFDLTNAAPDPTNGVSAANYIYELRAGENTDDNCRMGRNQSGINLIVATISIKRTDIDTNPDSKIDANLVFFRLVGGSCQMTSDIKSDIQVNNSFGKDLFVTGGTGVVPPGSVTGADDACYKSGWALSWLACPVITAAQEAANAMYGFVEDQLKFTVRQNCTSDSGCNDSLGADYKSVHSAWNNFRVLVSGLVVILLLVMVISQAIGTGPFDAYTVRKMLPRLVMGVILIQISWPVFSWIVNTVDHLGVGLADIMYAPFGGSKALDLNSVMEPFKTEGIVFSWVGIGALVVFGVVAPFVVLGLILIVLVAIFVGFLTLLFRKILIILALIFVPVALIAWMMPNDGLRKYWKLWWDNFIKALMN